MSNERKPGVSAEPGGGKPKSAESKTNGYSINGSNINGLSVRSFLLVLDSVIIKDAIKLFAWIASILIIAGLCWTLTQSVRSRFLVRAVNRVMEQYGDPRRVLELSSPAKGVSLIGSWYTMTKIWQPGITPNGNFSEGTKAFVFSFVAKGTFFPCAAVVDPEGRVQEFIPLNMHGKKILDQISPGILKLYITRIEGSES
jgi:hypothetical protein